MRDGQAAAVERDVWFGVLGPLLVHSARAPVPVPAAKQRVVLAALALQAGHVVSADALAEIVWDGAAADGARVTLRNYVMRLRRVLGPGAGDRITTRPTGYLLEAGASEVDALAFGQQCREGGAAVRSASWQRAWELLSGALKLWRGSPLADVPSEALHRDHVPALEQLRLQAAEWRAEAGLALGWDAELAGELQELVAAHPLRERFWAQLMRALSRCGRAGDALAAYHQARQALVRELGVEPGSELQDLHKRILAGDPEPGPVRRSVELAPTTAGRLLVPGSRPGDRGGKDLRLSRDPPAGPDLRPGPDLSADAGGLDESGHWEDALPGTGPTWVVPRQLPAGVRHFAGRAAEVKALTGLLDQTGETGAVVIAAICGAPGVGKTALAVHWAHQVAAEFPDGQLYVNLGGFGPSGTAVAPAQAIRYFLGALAVPDTRIPPGEKEQAALYRSLLAGKRMLVVLDNARDTAHAEPLLPGSPGCLALVTSRSQLTGLAAVHGAQVLTLDVLTWADARELLSHRIGAERVAAEPTAVADLIDRCARLPLALAIAATHATTRPGLPLTTLAAELRDESSRLDVLDTGDGTSSVRTVFSWSYQQLSEAAARMFWQLGLHPGPHITAIAAASLADVPLPLARRALRDLTSAHLISEQAPDRYTLHDLLCDYAAEQAEAADDQARRAAIHRLVEHYLHTARAADKLLYPARHAIALAAPRPGVTPGSLTSLSEALAWFDTEHRVLIAVTDLAARRGFDTHAWQLAWTMETFCYRRARAHDWAIVQRAALASAERIGDRGAQAGAHRGIGNANLLLGRYGEALDEFGHALRLYRETGDRYGQIRIHLDISRVFDHQERASEALAQTRRALPLISATVDPATRADVLQHLGWHLAQTGQYERALRIIRGALAMQTKLGNKHGIGPALNSLAYVHRHLGNHGEAADFARRAIDAHAELGHPLSEAMTLIDVGDVHRVSGDLRAAREAWTQALACLDSLGIPAVDRVRAKLRELDTADGMMS